MKALARTMDAPSGGVRRLAVLPLANISPDPTDAYFAEGMTDELISTLSKLPGLRVIARTSAMRYRGTSKSAAEIGRELGVSALVEGSVRKAGAKLRIAVELVDAATEEHLWSEEYDRSLEDVFAIQRDIARRIARALRVRLRSPTPEPSGRPATERVDAYSLYLRGRFLWNQRTEASLQEALEVFDRALAIDPGYALAHTGRADSYATLGLLEFVPPSDAFPKARRAAEQALALDDRLAEAHASLGLVRFQYDRDWEGAESSLRRALELDPNYPVAHQFLADYLKGMGRFDEALAEMQRALELDPLSLPINTGVGHVLYLKRDYDRAITQYRAALALDPGFVLAHLWFGRPFLQTGRYTEAIAEVEQAVELSQGSTMALAVLAHVCASAGNRDRARKILAELLDRARQRYVPSYWIALVHTGLGDEAQALDWLERAEAERSSWLVWIGVEPRFDGLRATPRFRSLLTRMRLDHGPDTAATAEATRIRTALEGLEEIRLSHYRIMGSYVRWDETARNRLKELRSRLVEALGPHAPRNDNFLLHAPPGTGKTFFVREVTRAAGPSARYVELNLSEVDEGAFRSGLAEIARSTEPVLCLVDEIDARPNEPWPYEALLGVLDRGGAAGPSRVFVLAGSGGDDLAALRERIAGRPKGTDLLSRIPRSNEYAVPGLTPEDRLLVAVSNVRGAAGASGRSVAEVEKLALYYFATHPTLANARQLREFSVRSLDRMQASTDQLRFDHLFAPGDPENKRFWLEARRSAGPLIDRFVRIED